MATQDSLPVLRLKAHEERRLRQGHLWIYSNEIDVAQTPLKGVTPGSLCRFEEARGKPLGIGYVNPSTLLCARLLTGKGDATIDADWLARRIESALALRTRIYPTPHYRLVYGESDGLPGLVVDRYGEVLVAQLTTAGMENLKAAVIEALQSVIKPRGILLRNDTSAREVEGLPLYEEPIGDVPELAEVIEGECTFAAPILRGQKTGWFFDQHDNRDRLARYVKGARVLDVFSYVGAWGVRAMKLGAASVGCVDSSEPALEAAHENAERNGFEIEAIQGQALEVMKALRADGRQYEVVVVDPPALIKKRKDFEAGLEHYATLNRAAMNLLTPDGILIACSCSHHMEEESLQRVLLREARRNGRRLQLLERGAQGPDHPVHPAIPETRYLKAFFCRLA
ncbi:MAG TPA: class I SAM-dependent rRNA methyltransferase [Nevskiaceae bacterium]|nr:class I SAM-dependent rRNA methyltransferase [Nevskiaceae bacterium]